MTGNISLAAFFLATASATTHGITIAGIGGSGQASSLAELTPGVEASIGGGNITSSTGGISLSARYNAQANGSPVTGE